MTACKLGSVQARPSLVLAEAAPPAGAAAASAVVVPIYKFKS